MCTFEVKAGPLYTLLAAVFALYRPAGVDDGRSSLNALFRSFWMRCVWRREEVENGDTPRPASACLLILLSASARVGRPSLSPFSLLSPSFSLSSPLPSSSLCCCRPVAIDRRAMFVSSPSDPSLERSPKLRKAFSNAKPASCPDCTASAAPFSLPTSRTSSTPDAMRLTLRAPPPPFHPPLLSSSCLVISSSSAHSSSSSDQLSLPDTSA
mmetsp:Transcript_16053/g.40592  ORF Transcript_16053/g.40592 Transcript_16053/m.40592 type:complete len:211 (-) Transcript_16053:809-1441(-)